MVVARFPLCYSLTLDPSPYPPPLRGEGEPEPPEPSPSGRMVAQALPAPGRVAEGREGFVSRPA